MDDGWVEKVFFSCSFSVGRTQTSQQWKHIQKISTEYLLLLLSVHISSKNTQRKWNKNVPSTIRHIVQGGRPFASDQKMPGKHDVSALPAWTDSLSDKSYFMTRWTCFQLGFARLLEHAVSYIHLSGHQVFLCDFGWTLVEPMRNSPKPLQEEMWRFDYKQQWRLL